MIIEDLAEFAKLIEANKPLLALDVGSKKIGLAISDNNKKFSMPADIWLNNREFVSKISNFIISKKTYGIIVGIPYNMDGTKSSNAKFIEEFITKNLIPLSQPIFLQDERLTTRLADNLLKMTGMKRKERNALDDSISASLILDTVIQKFTHLG